MDYQKNSTPKIQANGHFIFPPTPRKMQKDQGRCGTTASVTAPSSVRSTESNCLFALRVYLSPEKFRVPCVARCTV